MTETPALRPERRLFGRASGHKLTARQQGLVDEFLPTLSWGEGAVVDPADLLPGFETRVLEIGFGGAEHLIAQASRHPDKGYLGIEPFLNGVAKALAGIEKGALKNVRVKRGDARDEMERMPDAAFEEIYLLFPDPWPKRKHDKRRFVQPDTARHLARVLKPGGRLRVGTDVKVYTDWALPILIATPGLSWSGERREDWANAPADHITTRYQSKNLGDCLPVFMDFFKDV
ncbi:tRNA (guanosine(46)-N7)-methyltransferase TrmB [Woodsholea maritima]|uniref:tRNA (guanosine(46)-N7)-methyltransferase TrmB n=1 Tax=Woodsholea maritima TaxID=240237 RepID=UPI0003638011|nr:tRNA (guanosine(46)-N7)-methyltransferase TrmB [Woodsholea maritima]